MKERQNRLRGKSDEYRVILPEIREEDLPAHFEDPPKIAAVFRPDHKHIVSHRPQQIDFLGIPDVIRVLCGDKNNPFILQVLIQNKHPSGQKNSAYLLYTTNRQCGCPSLSPIRQGPIHN